MPGITGARPWLTAFLFVFVIFLSSRTKYSSRNKLPQNESVPPGSKPVSYHQRIGEPCRVLQFPGAGEASRKAAIDPAHPGSWPVLFYKTISHHPPVLKIRYNTRPSASGYIFMNQKSTDPRTSSSYRFGLYIFIDDGDLVWASEVTWSRGLQVQTYQGQPVLTFWSGSQSAAKGISWGAIIVLDSTYRHVHTVCPRLGLTHSPGHEDAVCEADLHEASFTEDDTILVTAYDQVLADLSEYGGPEHGWLYDCLAYEVDVATSEVLWRWSASEHVSLKSSRVADFRTKPTLGSLHDAWDWFHINSIQKLGEDYLINARNTFQTYLVSAHGTVLWTLDGETGGDFGPLPKDLRIAFSHNTRIISTTRERLALTIFNNANGNGRYGVNASHGLLLHLPLPPGDSQVRVVQRFADPVNPLYSIAQGNVQHLAPEDKRQANHYLVGYGYVPVAQEWRVDATDPNMPAQLVWEARFGHDNDQRQYRVERHEWHGTPTQDPLLVVQETRSGGCKYWHGYVSWNGATEVEAWAVYVSKDAINAVFVGHVEKQSFETRFNVAAGSVCVKVAAVKNGGIEERMSNLVCGL